MLSWKQQGPAYTASVILEGGEHANAVVLAAFGNARGAVIVRKDPEGAESTSAVADCASLLRSSDLIEIYCMQERAFGSRGLPQPVV